MDLKKLLKTQWDRSAAIALTALGAIFLIVGWVGVSGTAYLAEQAPYIVSGGIGGLFLLGLGATLWVSADLRDEWRKLDRIEAAIGEGVLRWEQEEGYPPPAARTVAAEQPVVAVLPVPVEEPAKAARAVKPVKPAVTRAAPRRTPAARPRVKATAE
jgi:hypothetical protein